MKKTLKMIVGLLSAAAILSVGACASLNPNTEAQLRQALEAKQGKFQECHMSALDRDRETKGTVTLKLKLHEETGEVLAASVERTDVRDTTMNVCVSNAVSDISLPEPPGLPVEAEYDIVFDFVE
jgi:hypothetical protein